MRLCGSKKWIMGGMLSAGLLFSSPHLVIADGTSNLPSLGDAGGSDLSVQDERKLGELIMRDYRSMGEINDDPEITGFLNRFGDKLVSAAGASPSDFEFFLVTDPTINAFALPGGHIGVHTGLIATAQTESELASVLAHEIGHVTQRHIARMYSHQKQTSLVSTAAVIAAILVAGSNPDAAQGIVAAGAGYSADQQLKFSRDSEREADRVGFKTLVAAGYNPEGMVDFFERLQKASRLYENNAPAFLQTHPLTAERIADIRNRAEATPHDKVYDDDPLTFELVRTKCLVYGTKSNQDLLDLLETLKTPMKQRHFLNPIELTYGRALVLAKLDRNKEALSAINSAVAQFQSTQSVVKTRPMPMMLAAEQLRLEMAMYAKTHGDNVPPRLETALNPDEKRILTAFENFRETYKGDIAVKLQYAQGLQQLGLHQKAAEYLRDLAVLYRSNAEVYDLSAKSAEALGKPAELHFFLAQAYGARGAYLPAIEQTRIAKKYAADNYYLLAEIDAKQRDFKQKADEQREMSKMMQ